MDKKHSYCFGEMVKINGGKAKKIVAAESAYRRHLHKPSLVAE